MALKPQLSFSSGELDPILHDRVTLERFQNALATARNVLISKTGTVMSRFSTFHFKKAFYDDQPIKLYCPPNSGVLFEFGFTDSTVLNNQYIILHDFSGQTLQLFLAVDHGFMFKKEELDDLHFTSSGDYVYVFGAYDGGEQKKRVFRIKYKNGYGIDLFDKIFKIPAIEGTVPWNVEHNGTGYLIEYAFTGVFEGQESQPRFVFPTFDLKKPISVSEKNTITVTLFTNSDPLTLQNFKNSINEIYFYQRPKEGSAFGYLGKTTNIYIETDKVKGKFVDIGGAADYSINPPSLVSKERLSNLPDIGIHSFKTGTIYQQRLLLGNFTDYNKEAILASRPGFPNNFYRDYPYTADSALNFKAGTSGGAEVLRMIESDGLIVFTTLGPYISVGPLGPDNIALQRRGGWIINEKIPPLSIPGGLFFVDKTTNTVKLLQYSQELGSFVASDQSIFSDHLFREKLITSWSFQDGLAQIIIVTFSDGTYATFTYDVEHQLKAWTRHDTHYPVEQVEGTGTANSDTTFFVVNKNGTRYIEMSVPRKVPTNVKVNNPEYELLAYGAFMDGLKVSRTKVNEFLKPSERLTLTPVVPNEWDGDLILDCESSEIFVTPGPTSPGTILRFFNPKDKTRIDLVCKENIDDNKVIVTPSEEFPKEYSNGVTIYFTANTIFGLDHLEGEEVSVICDGDLISSPFNDHDEFSSLVLKVNMGMLQLPEDVYSAITVVGRPIVADTKTLNISTAEQSPTMIESLTVNKLYIKYYESKGLYMGNDFPEVYKGEEDGTTVKDMQNLDYYNDDSGAPIIGNRAKPNNTKRAEVTLPGDWKNQGQMAIRQVDPYHFEIMSIIADIEILNRGR